MFFIPPGILRLSSCCGFPLWWIGFPAKTFIIAGDRLKKGVFGSEYRRKLWIARDYLYISVCGNRNGRGRTLANVMLTMLIGGLWHGASWRFAVWGGLAGRGTDVHSGGDRGREGV